MKILYIIYTLSLLLFLTSCSSINNQYNMAAYTPSNGIEYKSKFNDDAIKDGDKFTFKISTPQQLIAQFSRIKSVNGKTEFESFDDYDKRVKDLENNTFFNNNYFSTISKSYLSINYNIDTSRFKYSIKKYYLPDIYYAPGKLEHLPFAIELSTKIVGDSSYAGSNIFGVTRNVSKTDFKDVVVYCNNIDDIKMNINTHLDSTGIPDEIIGYSIKVEPKTAEAIHKNLIAVIEFKPKSHYIFGDKRGVISKSTHSFKPTLSDPQHFTTKTDVLFVNISKVYLIDKNTRIIYGVIDF